MSNLSWNLILRVVLVGNLAAGIILFVLGKDPTTNFLIALLAQGGIIDNKIDNFTEGRVFKF